MLNPALVGGESPAPTHLGVGATFDTLQVGAVIYQQVKVRSVNARTLMISHAAGLASIRLRDLSPELQVAFGYDPNAEAVAESALKDAEIRSEQTRAREAQARTKAEAMKPSAAATQIDRLMQKIGQPPELHSGVDLRPRYLELGLNVKNQGMRPSCSVFAIVSALEFQNAEINGQPERFSEEYLIWATCKTLKRAPRLRGEAEADDKTKNAEPDETADEGFSLSEVITALRAYGIPLQSRLPNTFSLKNFIADPPADVIDEARSHRRVSVFELPGRDGPTRIANLIHALNEGVPVAVGIRWPPPHAVRNGYLGKQLPMPDTEAGHAVTIVGYENKTGALADMVFIFKNSWGMQWGAGGFGHATYGYLAKNLEETVVLEVEPATPDSRRPR